MNKKRCHTLLPLVQLLPAVAAAAAVLFALPRTVPVLAAVPERLTAVVEQPVEAASVEAEEEALPKLPYADGVYTGSSRGFGGTVQVQVTMEGGRITDVQVLPTETEEPTFTEKVRAALEAFFSGKEQSASSGRVYTADELDAAVQDALQKALTTPEVPAASEPEAPAESEPAAEPAAESSPAAEPPEQDQPTGEENA